MGIKIYFAGPLFTSAEKMWNFNLVEAIKKQDHTITVFLPQIETKPPLMKSPPDFSEVQRICLNGVKSADVVVAVLDGPDSDSGTCFECGYAVANGKHVVGVRTDLRAGEDQGLNAMLAESCDALVFYYGDGNSEELELLAKKIVEAIRSCNVGKNN